jgi:L-fuconolactonase
MVAHDVAFSSGSSQFYPNDAWLSGWDEAPLEPSLPIVDAHHHLWDRPQYRYLAEEYAADAGNGHNIIASVCVEANFKYKNDCAPAMRSLGETEFLGSIEPWSAQSARAIRIAAGVVAFADLSVGSTVQQVLEGHVNVGGGRLRGIRHAVAWDKDPAIGNSHTNPQPGLMLDPEFRAGFSRLAPLGLSFDAWLYHPQLVELIDLARRFPETSIALDHAGGPLGRGSYAGRRSEVFAQWRQSMTGLARCENVVVKLGGLGMRRMALFDFPDQSAPPSSATLADAWRPYIQTCLDLFGPHRLMFESNFPVDKVTCSYTVLWNAFKRMTVQYSPEERKLLFCDTARRFYRIA